MRLPLGLPLAFPVLQPRWLTFPNVHTCIESDPEITRLTNALALKK